MKYKCAMIKGLGKWSEYLKLQETLKLQEMRMPL